jgi:hypothetical protein
MLLPSSSNRPPVFGKLKNRAKPILGAFRSSACWRRSTRLGIPWRCSGKALKCECKGRATVYTAFVKGSATGIEANGADILSV